MEWLGRRSRRNSTWEVMPKSAAVSAALRLKGPSGHSKKKGFILYFYKISCPYKITLPSSVGLSIGISGFAKPVQLLLSGDIKLLFLTYPKSKQLYSLLLLQSIPSFLSISSREDGVFQTLFPLNPNNTNKSLWQKTK